MKLDLKKIIDMPGASVPFECELSTESLEFESVRKYNSVPNASGCVYNEAGVLHLEADITADMLCICDRCGEEFRSIKETPVDVILVEENPEDDPELFVIEGEEADLDEILSTCLILDMETKFLCREGCKGLWPTCGKNLNLGPCECRKQPDPRFAVLEQLLDK